MKACQPACRRKKPDVGRMVILAFRHQGPMTDAQLVWWLEHFGMKAASVRSARRRLAQKGLVRFTRKFRMTAPGRYGMVWEESPGRVGGGNP